MRSARLMARRRIQMKMLALIEPEAIARASRAVGLARKIAVAFCCQRLKNPLRPWVHIHFDHDIDASPLWRPDTEVGPARRDHFGADRGPALEGVMVHAFNSPTSRGTVVASI